MQNFRTYQLSLAFYRAANNELGMLPNHLKDQMLRASSSICLNLAEGWGKRTTKDRLKFFQQAFGSTRECQSILELHPMTESTSNSLNHLAASLFKLIKNAPI